MGFSQQYLLYCGKIEIVPIFLDVFYKPFHQNSFFIIQQPIARSYYSWYWFTIRDSVPAIQSSLKTIGRAYCDILADTRIRVIRTDSPLCREGQFGMQRDFCDTTTPSLPPTLRPHTDEHRLLYEYQVLLHMQLTTEYRYIPIKSISDLETWTEQTI